MKAGDKPTAIALGSRAPAPTESHEAATPTVIETGTEIPVYDADTDINTIPVPTGQPDSELQSATTRPTLQGLVADCLREKELEHTFRPPVLVPRDHIPSWPAGPISGTAEWAALDGETNRPLGDDYGWRTAGCRGNAGHLTGMDDANYCAEHGWAKKS
jgi:hypothetical protein